MASIASQPLFRGTPFEASVRGPAAVQLTPLTLSTSTIAEESAAGTVVGAIQGATEGSTLSIQAQSNASWFAISGGDLVVGSTPPDFETNPTPTVTIRETLAGATNTPRDTVFTVTVTDVAEAQPTPTYVGQTGGTTAFQNSWSINTGSAVGDFMVLVVSATHTFGVGTPSGWTVVSDQTATNSMLIAVRTATAANETASATAPASAAHAMVVFRFTGADNASATTAANVSSNPPSHDAGASRNHRWLAIATSRDGGGGPSVFTTGPAGYSNFLAQTSGGTCIGIAQRAAAAQTEDPGAFAPTTDGRVATVAIWKA